MPLALVTGATAGIGRAFSVRLARGGYDVVLVSRTREDLASVAEEIRRCHGVGAETIAADLSTPEGCREVEERITSGTALDLLVNNAGTALSEPFTDNPVEAEERVLDLNVRAVLRLTRAVLPGMIERRRGQVVNVSSFTALGTGGLSTTYPASKAWVLRFSEALGRSAQLREAGVRVMALLPGFTTTELFERSGFETGHLPGWLWLRSEYVVDTALRDLARGKFVSVPSLRYKTASWALRHLPYPLLRSTVWDLSAPNRFWGTGEGDGPAGDSTAGGGRSTGPGTADPAG